MCIQLWSLTTSGIRPSTIEETHHFFRWGPRQIRALWLRWKAGRCSWHEKLLKSSGLHDAYTICMCIYICLYHVKKNKVDDLYHKKIIYTYIVLCSIYMYIIHINSMIRVHRNWLMRVVPRKLYRSTHAMFEKNTAGSHGWTLTKHGWKIPFKIHLQMGDFTASHVRFSEGMPPG